MKRTRDEIAIAGKTPSLSVGSQIVLRVSPDDLLKGEPRDAFLWEPDKCVQGARARISELLPGSNHCLSPESEAAWQYVTGGPNAVRHWNDLEPVFKANSRRALGFTALLYQKVSMYMVGDSDSDEWEEEEEEEEEEGDEPDDRSEEVSYGPMDAWMGRCRQCHRKPCACEKADQDDDDSLSASSSSSSS
jgi:hypothetical protein